MSKLKPKTTIMTQHQLAKQLIRLRMKFYMQITADALDRHKHLLILTVLILGPMLIGVVLASVQPVIELIYPKSIMQNLAVWAGLVLLNAIWIGLQTKALSGGEGWKYLLMMPLSRDFRFRLELRFLASLGFLILIPFVLAIIYLWFEYEILSSILSCLLLLCWMLHLILIQMLQLQRNQFLYLYVALSFCPILSLCFFELKFIGLIISISLLWMGHRLWTRGKQQKKIPLKLPRSFKFRATHTLMMNLVKLRCRQIFQTKFIVHRFIFFLISFSAIAILYWFAHQTDTWEVLSIELTPLQLFSMISALYLTFVFMQLGVIKMDLKHHFAQDEKFWIAQGVRMNQLNQAEYIVLLFIALLAYLPSIFWILQINSMKNVGVIILLLTICIPIIQWFYRKPTEIHGVFPVILASIWFGLSFYALSF